MWHVKLSTRATKQYKQLQKNGRNRPSTVDTIDLLMLELAANGPEQREWPNYGKLSEYRYHCHLKKGRPTYVACWMELDRKLKHIEVYYVGTHEGAPY